jgi:hypothetical protein
MSGSLGPRPASGDVFIEQATERSDLVRVVQKHIALLGHID